MADRAIHQADIRRFLDASINPLANFLASVLSTTCDNWWENAVLGVLTHQQHQRIRFQQITTLAGLDLSALLRVFAKNWGRIAEARNLAWEGINYVKEMQTVRNKWAHMCSEAAVIDDLYRDLDTIERFCLLIEADKKIIDEIKLAKSPFFYGVEASVNETKKQTQRAQPDKEEVKRCAEVLSGIPQYYEVFTEVLEILSDDKMRTLHEIRFELGIKLSYPEKILHAMKEKDTIGWCTWHLKTAGLIERPRRGINAITDFGKNFLEKHAYITKDVLKTIPSYLEKTKK